MYFHLILIVILSILILSVKNKKGLGWEFAYNRQNLLSMMKVILLTVPIIINSFTVMFDKQEYLSFSVLRNKHY